MPLSLNNSLNFFILIIVLTLHAGCSTQPKNLYEYTQFSLESGNALEDEKYSLKVGDELDVNFFYFPHLNKTLKIRPDGYISMVPIGDVLAQGLTVEKLSRKLTNLYSDYVDDPLLTVILKESSNQMVYIGGEVKRAGTYDLKYDMTLLSSIFNAGGTLDTANLEQVLLIRRSRDGNPDMVTINLKKFLNNQAKDSNGQLLANDIVLNPLDIVYVPKTRIAEINQFVDQYIVNVLPFNTNLGFSYILNSKRTISVTR